MKTIVIYTQRVDGERHWIDVCADGVQSDPIGPFASKIECQMAYDDLLEMMRSAGAVDLPSQRQ